MIKIIIEKELEDWWGCEDILALSELSKEDKIKEIIDLVNEDVIALLDNAKWIVEGVD
jgi:hypothetical protein